MDDLIRRSDAIRIASGYCHWSNIPKELEKLPSVSTEKTGRWKRRIVDSGYNADWSCSCCGYKVKLDFFNFKYCPNCGARMGVEE